MTLDEYIKIAAEELMQHPDMLNVASRYVDILKLDLKNPKHFAIMLELPRALSRLMLEDAAKEMNLKGGTPQ